MMVTAPIFREERDAIPIEHLANGWLEADVLPTKVIAEVRRKVHGVVPTFNNAYRDVSDLVALMANARISEKFEGVDSSGREVAALWWLAAAEDVEAIGATVDMEMGEDGDDA